MGPLNIWPTSPPTTFIEPVCDNNNDDNVPDDITGNMIHEITKLTLRALLRTPRDEPF